MKRSDLKGLVNLPKVEKRPTQIEFRRFPLSVSYLSHFDRRVGPQAPPLNLSPVRRNGMRREHCRSGILRRCPREKCRRH